MYNLRYHIASLVAVFLALMVGLLLGTIVAERGVLDAQREALVAGLERDFDDLLKRNTELSEKNSAMLEFLTASLPGLTAGRLEGRQVIVVTSEADAETYEAIAETIRAAGGSPVNIVLMYEGLGLTRAETTAALSPLFDIAGEGLRSSVVTSLAGEWSASGPRPVTSALMAAGVLGGDVLPEAAGAQGIVTLAAWDNVPDRAGLELAEQMGLRNLPAVGIEVIGTKTGLASAAAELELSAVDHFGTPEGAYSLVAMLSGQAQGYFGTADAAEGRFPSISGRR